MSNGRPGSLRGGPRNPGGPSEELPGNIRGGWTGGDGQRTLGFMRQYLDLLQHILDHGQHKPDRTGTGTRSVFGYQMRFNLTPAPGSQAPGTGAGGTTGDVAGVQGKASGGGEELPRDLPGELPGKLPGGGFPLVTTKKLHLRSIIHELLWFLRGDTNIAYLKEHNVRIWDEWADEQGNLGPVYGSQWRSWPDYAGGHIDQIANVLRALKENPDSRRHIVSAWNVAQVDQMKLPPCHAFFQFYVSPPPGSYPRGTAAPASHLTHARSEEPRDEGRDQPTQRPRLSCQLYQRSADVFLGVPFNIASYALLTMMVAQVCDYEPGEFIHTLGDAHLYDNHLDQAREQLTRDPRPLPTMKINPAVKDLFAFTFDDFELLNYNPHPHIKAPIAV